MVFRACALVTTAALFALLVSCTPAQDSNRTRIAQTDRAETAAVRLTALPDQLNPTNTAPPVVGEVSPAPRQTPTLFIFPAAVVATPECQNAPRSRLIIHERGRVTDEDPSRLRMRSGPGTQNTIVAQLAVDTVFFVLEGPVCGDTYAWWRVRYRDQEGWIAEGEPGLYYVEPYLPG